MRDTVLSCRLHSVGCSQCRLNSKLVVIVAANVAVLIGFLVTRISYVSSLYIGRSFAAGCSLACLTLFLHHAIRCLGLLWTLISSSRSALKRMPRASPHDGLRFNFYASRQSLSGAQITALPLNGRSYTDLLAVQSGVTPISALLLSSVVTAELTRIPDPSGDLNPGTLSIIGAYDGSASVIPKSRLDLHIPRPAHVCLLPKTVQLSAATKPADCP